MMERAAERAAAWPCCARPGPGRGYSGPGPARTPCAPAGPGRTAAPAGEPPGGRRSDRGRAAEDGGGPPGGGLPGALPARGPGPGRPAAEVPRWLRVSAGWAWRLLLLAALLYVAGKVAALLYLVIVPFAAAILLTALLQPLTARLRRRGLGPLSATWCTLLLAFALIGGAVWLVTTRVEAEYPALVTQVGRTSTQIQNWLASLAVPHQDGEPGEDLRQPGELPQPAPLHGRGRGADRRQDRRRAAGRHRAVLLHLVLPDQGRRADLVLAGQRAVRRARAAGEPGGPRRLAGRRLLRQGHRRGGRDPRRRHGDHAHDHRLAAGGAARAVHVRRPRSSRWPAC